MWTMENFSRYGRTLLLFFIGCFLYLWEFRSSSAHFCGIRCQGNISAGRISRESYCLQTLRSSSCCKSVTDLQAQAHVLDEQFVRVQFAIINEAGKIVAE